jgi:hypothetical protein
MVRFHMPKAKPGAVLMHPSGRIARKLPVAGFNNCFTRVNASTLQ